MNINFPIEEAVRKRYSVRNYSEKEVELEKRSAIEAFVDLLENPFGVKVNFHYFSREDSNEKLKLGTYGVIKGARNYIGTTISFEPLTLEALGYELEATMLYLAHLGLGTCWLGGTFDRKGFADALKLEEGESLPIITPFGYPAEKKHIKEAAMRKLVKADQRKDWEELFFAGDFETPLTKEAAGDLALPLEMVRLGPSASNKQPWRVLVVDGACHFYEYKTPGYSSVFPYDIQRIDMGIAAAHFDLAVKEQGMAGRFEVGIGPDVRLPEHFEYVFRWVRGD